MMSTSNGSRKKTEPTFYNLCCAKGTHILQFGSGGLEIEIVLRDLIIYLFYLASVSVIALNMSTPNMFYFTNALSSYIVDGSYENSKYGSNFHYAATVPQFWDVSQNHLLKTIYGKGAFTFPEENNETGKENEPELVLNQNILIGSPRLRQLRVRNGSCVIEEDFQMVISNCYAKYSEDTASKEPFGRKNGTAWVYSSKAVLKGQSHIGIYSYYGAGGFSIDLGNEFGEAHKILIELSNYLWIDQATRVVFIDFTIYNPNVDLFCIIRLVSEFLPTGGLLTSWKFRTTRFYQYQFASDIAVLVSQIAFAILSIYYIIRELIEAATTKLNYLKSPWNYLDATILFFAVLCMGFAIYRYSAFNNVLKEYLENPNAYPNFESLGFWQTQFQYAFALIAFLSWIKLFQFIRFNQTMVQLSTTLSRCSKDIIGFGIMFFVIFLAFAQMGCMIFGTVLTEFRDIPQAILTLLRFILGDFDFDALQHVNRVLGPLYFVVYIFSVYFILMNMFLAIISDTYSEVKVEFEEQSKANLVPNYFKLAAALIHSKWKSKCPSLSLCLAMRKRKKRSEGESGENKTLNRTEIADMLIREGMDKPAIRKFFHDHSIDKNTQMTGGHLESILTLWNRDRSGNFYKRKTQDESLSSSTGSFKLKRKKASSKLFPKRQRKIQGDRDILRGLHDSVGKLEKKMSEFERKLARINSETLERDLNSD